MRVTKFLRIRLLATCRDRLWTRGRSWYGVSLIGGTSCASTRNSFLSTDAKRTSSAVSHISSNEGELRGKNPNLCSLNMKFCSCSLWPIPAYPHHAGDAYNILASMVARVTSQRASPVRPCERRTLSAYIEFEYMIHGSQFDEADLGGGLNNIIPLRPRYYGSFSCIIVTLLLLSAVSGDGECNPWQGHQVKHPVNDLFQQFTRWY